MHTKQTSFIVSIVILNLVLVMSASPAAEPDNAAATSPAAICRELGHGINLGNALEAPSEGAWGVTLQEAYFTAIQQAGFTTIRVPISWPAHAAKEAPYAIDPEFEKRVDWVVAEAKSHHLNAILDFHNYEALFKDPSGEHDRFLALWKQVAERYQSEPSTILFELLNEPHGELKAQEWNQLLAEAIGVIRASNPNRLIIVGPIGWNSTNALPELVLPETDRNLVATVHFYGPMKFTHQGAGWVQGSSAWLGTKWQGTGAEKGEIEHTMGLAAAWGKAHQRPMFLGEFGSFEKGDMESRVRWTTFVARAAEAHGMAWAYWEFCSGFGAYDPVANQWRAPLLNALLPNSKP